jgi:hypothetical protein
MDIVQRELCTPNQYGIMHSGIVNRNRSLGRGALVLSIQPLHGHRTMVSWCPKGAPLIWPLLAGQCADCQKSQGTGDVLDWVDSPRFPHVLSRAGKERLRQYRRFRDQWLSLGRPQLRNVGWEDPKGFQKVGRDQPTLYNLFDTV